MLTKKYQVLKTDWLYSRAGEPPGEDFAIPITPGGFPNRVPHSGSPNYPFFRFFFFLLLRTNLMTIVPAADAAIRTERAPTRGAGRNAE